MATIRFKRGTSTQIQAAIAAGTLNEGEPYLETDTGRVNIGTGTNTLTQLARQSDVDAKVGSPNSSVVGVALYDSDDDLPEVGEVGVIYYVRESM